MDKYTCWDYLCEIWDEAWRTYKKLWGFSNWLQTILTVFIWFGGIVILFIFHFNDYVVESIVVQIVMFFSGVIVSVICLFILGAFVSPFKVHKKLADEKIVNDYYLMSIRITKTQDNKGLTLYNFSDSVFTGRICLIAITELDDFPPIILQTIDGDSDLNLLPKIPVQIRLVKLANNNAICIGKAGRIIEYRDGCNTLVISLSGEFKGHTKAVTNQSLWVIRFDKQSKTIQLDNKSANLSS